MVSVDFPLRGEWSALHSPAEKVPSHGTDYFGQRYAFDFARLDASSKYYPNSILRHVFGHVPASAFYAWQQPVHSCFDGVVVAAADGWPDHEEANLIGDMFRSSDIKGTDYRPLAGNHLIVRGAPGFALFAHLRHGSLQVGPGQKVRAGQHIGLVGNSGNSSMPHLHFQLMDAPDPLKAAGIHCAFRRYERFDGRTWLPVQDGVPAALERIRLP